MQGKNSKVALFSVDIFDEVVTFAKALSQMGWTILATSETVEYLKRHGIKTQNVDSFVGVTEDYGIPPTLHPKIEASLTTNAKERIDLIYDVPYPLSKGKDVGGLTLLALGAKGDRIISFCKEDMNIILDELQRDPYHFTISTELRKRLIDKAYAFIANHYLSLIQYQKEGQFDGIIGSAAMHLGAGENPYQIPADIFYLCREYDPLALPRFEIKSKANPCFVNLADIDCVLNSLCFAAESFNKRYGKTPFMTFAAKHGNPCGAAIDWNTPRNTIEKALLGNPHAIWGGEVILNFNIDRSLALLLSESKVREEKLGSPYWMLDIIASSSFDENAFQILSKRPSRKLIENKSLLNPNVSNFLWHYRQVRGGFLRQPAPSFILDITEIKGNISSFDDILIDSLILAWAISWTSNHGGNEVSIVKDGQLIGVGGGPSTVDAAKIAVQRAQESGHDCHGSVFAANAFFPFIDAPEILANAGCSAGLFPAGGKQEALVIKFFEEKNIPIIMVPAQFRGFCRH